MKTKLIQTTDYLLLIDEEAEIKKGNYYFANQGVMFCSKVKDDSKYPYLNQYGNYDSIHYKGVIIAYYPLTDEAKGLDLSLLPNPFEKEIGVEELACAKYNVKGGIRDYDERYYNTINVDKAEAFIEGYKAAQSKQFSLEDMIAFGKKCFYKGFDKSENDDANSFTAWREESSKLIQSLSTQQLLISFEPEYEEVASAKWGYGAPCDYKLKTITNSEGKEVVQGKWVY